MLPKIKAYSDLAYVLSEIKDQFKEVNLQGFLGERKDHELINLLEVHSFLSKYHRKIKVSFDDKIFSFSRGNWEMEIQGVFSVLALSEIDMEIKGACKYTHTLDEDFKHLSSQGLSNVGSGVVIFKASNVFFLFVNE